MLPKTRDNVNRWRALRIHSCPRTGEQSLAEAERLRAGYRRFMVPPSLEPHSLAAPSGYFTRFFLLSFLWGDSSLALNCTATCSVDTRVLYVFTFLWRSTKEVKKACPTRLVVDATETAKEPWRPKCAAPRRGCEQSKGNAIIEM